MSRLLTSLLISTPLCWGALTASAQSVIVGQLEAAQSYDVGPLNPNNGGLDASLWQGVSASRASQQIAAINSAELSELPYRFLRRVLLSAGVPPEGDEQAKADYLRNSTAAKLQLGDYNALASLSDPQNPLQRDAEFRVNLALATRDRKEACSESDRAIDNRTAPFWMQMRIVCHLMRDEAAAAELTLNLMRERDDSDDDFVALADHALGLRKNAPKNIPNSPVLKLLKEISTGEAETDMDYAGRALSNAETANERIEALFKSENRLAPDQVKTILSSLLITGSELAGGDESIFDVESALANLEAADTRGKSVGQLYSLATNYGDPYASAQATAALLKFSESVDYLPQMSDVLSETILFIPAEAQVELDPPRFAWAALRRGDLSALGALYRSLEAEDPLAGRIALASDALGNGFVLGQLGLDIESRINAMLGNETRKERINPVELARLNASAKIGARAGTLLYVVQGIGEREPKELTGLELYSYISALSQAGLTREAGELAAFDFLSRVPAAKAAEE